MSKDNTAINPIKVVYEDNDVLRTVEFDVEDGSIYRTVIDASAPNLVSIEAREVSPDGELAWQTELVLSHREMDVISAWFVTRNHGGECACECKCDKEEVDENQETLFSE